MLGDRRGAAVALARRVLRDRLGDRGRVDALVRPERPVLGDHGRVQHEVRDLRVAHHPPLLALEPGELHLAGAVVDDRWLRERQAAERRRIGQVPGQDVDGRDRREPDGAQHAGDHDREHEDDDPADEREVSRWPTFRRPRRCPARGRPGRGSGPGPRPVPVVAARRTRRRGVRGAGGGFRASRARDREVARPHARRSGVAARQVPARATLRCPSVGGKVACLVSADDRHPSCTGRRPWRGPRAATT